MADKKITQLNPLLASDVAPEDLLVIVDNSDIPITKNITYGDLLTGAKSTITSASQNTLSSIVPMKSEVKANIVFTVSSTVRAAEFVTNASTGASNTAYQYGIVARSRLTTANVTTEHASGKFVLDLSNAGSMVTNTHGLLIEIANTTLVRTTNAQSFIAFGDLASNSTSAQTLYLFDIGKNGSANVSANVGSGGATNVTTLFSNTSIGALTDITHKLRVRINGADFYILLANTAGVL